MRGTGHEAVAARDGLDEPGDRRAVRLRRGERQRRGHEEDGREGGGGEGREGGDGGGGGPVCVALRCVAVRCGALRCGAVRFFLFFIFGERWL